MHVLRVVEFAELVRWHDDDVDSAHVERIGCSGDQLLKNVRYEDVRFKKLYLIDGFGYDP